MCAKWCAVLQKSRAKDDKISTSDMMADTDSYSQQQWSVNEKSLREIGELAWKERTHSCLSRKQHFNFYLNREVKSTETNNVNDADEYLTKNCQQSGNGDAEQCARKFNENCESRCSTNW